MLKLRLLLVVLLVLPAWPAAARVIYRHPDGWSLEILEQVSYTELGEWKDGEGAFDRMAALVGMKGGFALTREMASHPADYYRGILRIDCPTALGLGPGCRFTARMDKGPAAVTERILFVDGIGEHQRRVFDSSTSWIKLCGNDAIQWLKRGDDRGIAVALHFPPGSTNGLDGIRSLEFSDGRQSGLSPSPPPQRP